MSRQTSFEIEDAEDFLNQLEQFQESLEQEWKEVSNQWENLRSTWQDDQYYQFESLFEDLSSTYIRIEKDFEKNVAVVRFQIRIVSFLKDLRVKSDFFSKSKEVFDKVSAVVQLVTTVAAPSIDAPNQVDVTQHLEQHYEYSHEQKIKERDDLLDLDTIVSNQPSISGSPPDPKT